MKALLGTLLFFSTSLLAQQVNEYGLRHLQIIFKGDTVDILLKSKPGEERVKKPLLLFCQGSLPIPLIIKYQEDGRKGIYPVFVFNTDSLCQDFHLAIISKPYVPLVADIGSLTKELTVADSLGNYSRLYTKRNLLNYYVDRNIQAIRFLRKQPYVSTSKLVIAGHSEGAAIAAAIAYKDKAVTALIYSGGSPLGRIMSILERVRRDQLTDTSKNAKDTFSYWDQAVNNKDNDDSNGDTFKGQYQFSNPPPIDNLLKLRIPVLVTYGTKDFGAVAQNDYLRVKAIAQQKLNFTFIDYPGLDHNFFPLLPNDRPNYDVFNWDKTANDWRTWLLQQ